VSALPVSAALARFGLGARPGSIAAAGRDPRGLFEAEMAAPGAGLLADPALPDGTASLAALYAYERTVREAAKASPMTSGMASPAASADGAMAAPRGMAASEPAMEVPKGPQGSQGPAKDAAKEPPKEQPLPTRMHWAEVSARLAHLTTGEGTAGGFVERLVRFWTNHFAVSTLKGGPVRVLSGPFEREAIRPHVLGRFADMLRAVETHPAMLLFLDSTLSLGPDSPAGRNRRRGLNENLAREIMELHTLGVGHYAQADVTALSGLITGWTVSGADGKLAPPGAFFFNPNWHQPGPLTVLGRTYPEPGFQRGVDALDALARNPATADFVALKLARHFVADVPPPALVGRLARTFRDTGGDLRAVSLALLAAPEAWDPAARKIRSPWEFVVAALRLPGGFASDLRPNAFLANLTALGEPLWSPAGPNGFPDTLDHWASPEGMKTRLDIAAKLAARVQADPGGITETAFSQGALSDESRHALAFAESRQQAAAILLMSPEFQRR